MKTKPMRSLAASIALILLSPAFAGSEEPLPPEWTAREDHRNMMEQLGIPSLRPGAEGMNRQAPNYQNTDESKANPWPELPDPLVLKAGRKVATAEMWWNERRPEIVEEFDREVYGRVPKVVPRVTWEVTGTATETIGGIPVVVKRLVGRADSSSFPAITVDIQLSLATPAGAAGPVPVMMEFGFDFGGAGGSGRRKSSGPPGGGPGWREQLLARGWGYAILVPGSIQADSGAGLRKGIIGLCNQGRPRKPDDWGALRAWAWGASRALDHLETDPAVDARQVGIEGLSRYGKAALVAMAYDPRFAIGFIGSSGAGGAKLFRRNFGELVENLAGSGEYHWMAGNFLKYAGPKNAGDLPVDSHQLIALCAPRPTFIGYGASSGPGAEGTWVDQRGSFLAAVAAGPVFRLLGKKDLGTSEFPAVETALIDGELAFRQHGGGHTSGPNWPTFLKWAERFIHAPAAGAESEKGRWVAISEGVTSKVETKWPGLTAGIAVDPASGEVYLAISGAGVWKSRDQGTTFEKVDAGHVGGRCETGASINVDPRGGGRLAFFQLDGKSAWTLDGGKTWKPCDDRSRGFDFVAVDWTDPAARRMFGVRHESGEVGLLSSDGGASWKTLDKGFLTFGVFDFETLVTHRGAGIERSTDGGATWTKVSDLKPSGRLMVHHHGAGWWLHEKGMLVSRDKGATWTLQGKAVSAWFGPYFGKDEKHLVVVGKDGFQETTDGGETWSLAAPLPGEKDFNGPWYPCYAWDSKADIFYASKMGKPAYRFRRAPSRS